MIRANIGRPDRVNAPETHVTPSSIFPKPRQDMPGVYGVEPEFRNIAGLKVVAGRIFHPDENDGRTPVCVLGEGAKANLFPQQEAVGQYVKINEQWFRVIGILGRGSRAQSELSGVKAEDSEQPHLYADQQHDLPPGRPTGAT